MTDKELTEALGSLKAAATRLNAESDSINSIIKSVEEQIAATNVGLETWLDTDVADQLDTQIVERGQGPVRKERVTELGWTKLLGDHWRLAIRSMILEYDEYGGSEEYQVTNDDGVPYASLALQSAPRPIRIRALSRLPRLVNKLAAEAQQAIETIGQAKKLVTD